jgi:hypothetical protein
MRSFSRGPGTYYTAELWIPVSLLSQYPVLSPVLAGGGGVPAFYSYTTYSMLHEHMKVIFSKLTWEKE